MSTQLSASTLKTLKTSLHSLRDAAKGLELAASEERLALSSARPQSGAVSAPRGSAEVAAMVRSLSKLLADQYGILEEGKTDPLRSGEGESAASSDARDGA